MSNHIVKRTAKPQTVSISKDDANLILELLTLAQYPSMNLNQMQVILELKFRLANLVKE